MTEKELRWKYINGLLALEGKCAEGSANHSALLAVYNTLSPLPRGVKMLPSYDWCAATITANAIRQDMAGIFAKECSCTMQIIQWKRMGRWIERDDYRPQPGDIIYYSWRATGSGDWVEDVDHVGAVVSCDGKQIVSIEGNYKNNVSRRTVPVDYKYIRGFAVPDYASLADQEDDEMIRWNKLDEIPAGYRKMAERYIEAGALRGKANGDLDLSEDMLRVMEIMRRYFEEG